MRAEACTGYMRKRVDEAVYPATPRRHELGVLATARINRDLRRAEQRRYVVRIQSRRINDRLRVNALLRRDDLLRLCAGGCVHERRSHEDGHILITAQPR